MRHKEGESRQQGTLFPETLDEYVAADNPVRVIDAFIDKLDMEALGFNYAVTKATGRKPYAPSDLLKLYIYGYLNQVRSTRRLEKECHRNVEVLWLMKRLAPDFKTISNFRQQNSRAIRQSCRGFIQFCREANLLNSAMVAIDGSKFTAAASMSKTYNRKQLDRLQKRLNRQIEGYLNLLKQSEQGEAESSPGAVEAALKKLQQRQSRLDALSNTMDEQGLSQVCETEAEVKRMRSGREGVIAGYNVQSAVDDETGLIVHHEVTNESTDNRQLAPMTKAVQAVLDRQTLRVLADAGYSNGEQLAELDSMGVEAVVPPNRARNNQGNYYQKHDFTYDEKRDCFICPVGKVLSYQTIQRKGKQKLYARSGCSQCAQQSACTKADKRWITRHFHEGALEQAQQRVDSNPQLMRRRSAIVERPFAQIKQTMNIRRFLCWGKEGASAEMGLTVLAYNLNRLMNEIGIERMLKLAG